MIVKLEVEINVAVAENDVTFSDIGISRIQNAVRSAAQTSLNNSYYLGYTHALEDKISLSKAKVILTDKTHSEMPNPQL